MCLNMITKRHAVPTTEERRAYKVIEVKGEVYTPFRYEPLKEGEWTAANEITLRTEGITLYPGIPESNFTQNVTTVALDKREFYPSGWHTFATRREARAFLKMIGPRINQRIVAVKVRGITTEGYDGSSYDHNFISAKIRTLVSKEMFIESFKRVR